MNFDGAAHYILERLDRELDRTLYYHNMEHTIDVVKAAQTLISMEKTNDRTGLLILTAALFHDTGMLVSYLDHEEESVKLMKEILPAYQYLPGDMEEIADLILATRDPAYAATDPAKILCDADMDVLGRSDFFIASFRLRLEWDLHGILHSTLKEWFESQVQFLEEHRFYTGSARMLREEQKARNLAEIKLLLHNTQTL
jgi:predicted metal-dependent HD superfamily phosphohydrolase